MSQVTTSRRAHRRMRVVFLNLFPIGCVVCRVIVSPSEVSLLAGFLHKPTFMHRLINTPTSISPFLLLSMLSVSARFTPSLIQRHKGPANAALVFAKRAEQLAGEEILGAATLERAQGFFLCSIWSWGSGFRDRSWVRNASRRILYASF